MPKNELNQSGGLRLQRRGGKFVIVAGAVDLVDLVDWVDGDGNSAHPGANFLSAPGTFNKLRA
jgi:hypothetical protein